MQRLFHTKTLKEDIENTKILTFHVSISYSKIPTLHQSAALSWPFPITISGAMYSTVPHIEFDLSFSLNFLARPKSVNTAWYQAQEYTMIQQDDS